jgi:hypothetical protein
LRVSSFCFPQTSQISSSLFPARLDFHVPEAGERASSWITHPGTEIRNDRFDGWWDRKVGYVLRRNQIFEFLQSHVQHPVTTSAAHLYIPPRHEFAISLSCTIQYPTHDPNASTVAQQAIFPRTFYALHGVRGKYFGGVIPFRKSMSSFIRLPCTSVASPENRATYIFWRDLIFFSGIFVFLFRLTWRTAGVLFYLCVSVFFLNGRAIKPKIGFWFM